MKINKLTTAMILATTMIAPLATASIVLTDTTEQMYRYDDKGNPFFAESGVSTEDSVVHIGSGESMPLGMVAELVVPDSWHIAIPNSAVGNMEVDVSGGKPWSHVLREMAEKNQIYTTIDWKNKKVTLDAADPLKLKLLANSRTKTAQELASEKAKSVIADYERQLASKRNTRDNQSVRNQMNQEVVDTALNSAKNSQEQSERIIGEVNSERQSKSLENKALQDQLVEAKKMISQLEGKLEVVGLAKAENKPEVEDLFAIYQSSSVLPFDSSFDYYIKGGYMDVIEYDTPATYIAKPGMVEDVLRDWASFSGFEVSWRTEVKHKVGHKLVFKGDLRKAGIELFSLYLKSDRPINIKFYPSVGESGLVVVEDLNHTEKKPNSINWLTK
jgi:hypothetical protein